MTAPPLSHRDRLAVQAGGVLILGLVLGFRGVPAWWSWQSRARDAAEAAATKAATTEATIAAFPATVDSLGARTARLAAIGPLLFVGTDSSTATAAFAEVITATARTASVRLDSVQTKMAPPGKGRLRRIVIEVRATADVIGLAALLAKLEGSPRYIAIRRAQVDPTAMDGPADQPELLRIRLTLEGLALITEPRPAE